MNIKGTPDIFAFLKGYKPEYIYSLEKSIDDGIITTTEATESMKKALDSMEKKVLKVHTNTISRRFDENKHTKEYCYTRIKTPTGSVKIGGSYEKLIAQLYIHYFEAEKEPKTLNDCRKGFEEWFKAGRQPATVRVSNQSYKHYKDSTLANTPVADISYQTVKKFFQEFSAKNNTMYSRSLYNKIRTDIYTMLEYCLDNDIIQQKIPTYRYTKDITVRFKQKKPRETWTVSEHKKLLDYLNTRNDPYSLLFEYQLLTGDRFETASAMIPSDVDYEHSLLYIHQHQTVAEPENRDFYCVSEGTKGNGSNGVRYVPLLAETVEIIRLATALNPDGKFVFEYNGKPLNPTTYRKKVKKICDAAGVDYHPPHATRNYAASVVNTGDNIGEMCDYFGWASKNMPTLYNRNICDDNSKMLSNLAKLAHRTTPHQFSHFKRKSRKY